MAVLRHRIRLPPALARPLRSLRHHLPPVNFLTLHYVYFIGVSLITSVIFWGSSTPPRSVTFTDSLFLTVSAMTLAGLNTVNLSKLNPFQQFLLFLLIMLGSAILVSSAVVHVRKKAFERKFKSIIKRERARRKADKATRTNEKTPSFFSRRRSSVLPEPEVDGVVVRGRAIHNSDSSDPASKDSEQDNPGNKPPRQLSEDTHMNRTTTAQDDAVEDLEAGDPSSEETTRDETRTGPDPDPTSPRVRFSSPTSPFTPRRHKRVFSMSGVGARPDLLNHPRRANPPSFPIPLAALTEAKGEALQGTHKYFSSQGFIGRNSQFHSLTLAERERLGGVEYRAVTLLAVVVPVYFVLWQLLGCVGLGAWVAVNAPEVAVGNGLNPWWVGAFNGVSAFNNSGMSLLDANMVGFQTSYYMLLTMGLMILAGNTCYPIFLRLILWSLHRLLPPTPTFASHKHTLRFLLDHPRRCYTTLFPSTHTWWLLAILIILNGVDWIAYEVLNIGNPTITTLDPGPRALTGLFQALAVRSGGFYVVPIADLRVGLLVLYVVMMYISVYPVVITMRNSNVYEERSLGIYADDPAPVAPSKHPLEESFLGGLKRRVTSRADAGGGKEGRAYFVRQQLRGQLAHDLWWIVLAVLFIVVVETGEFEADPVDYSVFNVIFEVISAYGCVGISVGLPNVAYSFCGGWHALSKLILCAVMIRGRHRGLPVAIDRAVLLPGEELGVAEEEDAAIRVERVMSRGFGG